MTSKSVPQIVRKSDERWMAPLGLEQRKCYRNTLHAALTDY